MATGITLGHVGEEGQFPAPLGLLGGTNGLGDEPQPARSPLGTPRSPTQQQPVESLAGPTLQDVGPPTSTYFRQT